MLQAGLALTKVRDECLNWEEANMHEQNVCVWGSFHVASSVQLVQLASLAAETTSGKILVAFWPTQLSSQ